MPASSVKLARAFDLTLLSEWRGFGESGGPAARRCGVLPAPPLRCRTGGSGCERSLLLVPVERRPGVEQRGQKIDTLQPVTFVQLGGPACRERVGPYGSP